MDAVGSENYFDERWISQIFDRNGSAAVQPKIRSPIPTHIIEMSNLEGLLCSMGE
jgi:hypothetical protein